MTLLSKVKLFHKDLHIRLIDKSKVKPIYVLVFKTDILEQLNKLKIDISKYEMNATYNTNTIKF
ncbi:hypothetical protein RhiirA4_484846 [Rhizophagus irregularis]|uniref:Uncharacterized protein n=1 Tax=Rhizophagus irregularis TaxID=588596 RepID=A0A2I1HPE7_9GLOM|nr:hypothetical protein RhiirA4_484846 [Rhizophagus irregularis]